MILLPFAACLVSSATLPKGHRAHSTEQSCLEGGGPWCSWDPCSYSSKTASRSSLNTVLCTLAASGAIRDAGQKDGLALPPTAQMDTLRVPRPPRECIILEAQVAPLPWGRWHILEGITLPHTTLSLQVSEALELRLLWDPKGQLSG